jgi:hypothetical protein
MIGKRVVLVLGAGASRPYGFPTGGELCQWIQGIFAETDDAKLRVSMHQKVVPFLREFGFEADDRKEFVDALSKSARESVDAFLEFRPEFLRIGKALMAYFLVLREDEGTLFRTHDW